MYFATISGYVAIPQVEFCTNQGCKSILLKPEYDEGFVYYNIIFHIDKIKRFGEGTTFSEISKTALAEIALPFPEDKSEQTQIAEILFIIDKAIEQNEALIAKQERIKAGLMQDLLTKGIDEHGNIRSEENDAFKDSPLGRIPAEWEVISIGKLATKITSGSRGWAKYYSEEGALFLRISNLTREHINLRFDDLIRVNPPESTEGKRTGVETGDILISITADLGIVGVIPHNFEQAYVNQHIALVRLDKEEIEPRWVGHLLSGKSCQRQFQILNDAGAKAGLNLPTIASLIILKPPDSEQQKITKILDQCDFSIAMEKTNLNKYRRLKKGLMQDLLTGRVRVTRLFNQNEKGIAGVA
jgi:type I restriction enzyme S subunit